MNTESLQLKEGIARILKIEQRDEMTADELIALLCQVSLALLIIFVMANVLFMSRAKAEVDVAKGMVGFLQGKLEEISKTPAGEQYKLREEAMMNLQKQKLLKVLAEFEALQRIKYGLSTFTRKENGGTVYLMDDLLSGTSIVNERFKNACGFIKKELPHRDALLKNWCTSVLLMEGMSLNDSPMEKTITSHPEVLTKDNEVWLLQEIDKRIKAIHEDSCTMQRNALAMMQKYYQDNTSALKGTEVYSLKMEYRTAPPERKAMLIREIQDRLYEHSKSVFEKQKVPLLNKV